MLPPLIDIDPFADAIARNCLILTPNHRLAAKITDAWAMRTEQSVWHSPRVYSIEHWLKQCWDELQDQNHELVGGLSVVGAQQSRYYWERAIAKEDAEHSSRYAKIAGDTLKTLQNWHLSPKQVPSGVPAADYFKRWSHSFTDLLKRNHLVTVQESWQIVEQGFNVDALPSEPEIMLYGFQSTPPLQAAIIACASPSVSIISSISQDTDVCLVEAQDAEEEMRLAANWAAQELQRNGHQRVGIVVPDLNNTLQQVARLTDEALKTQGTETVVNISAGAALADTALVNAALQLVGVLQYKRPLQDWLQLLYSPYCAFNLLGVQYRADCELALRRTRRFDFTLAQFLSCVVPDEVSDNALDGIPKQASDVDADRRDAILLALQPLIGLKTVSRLKTGALKNFSGWADFLNQFLDEMGWPGNRQLNSIEYQQRQHWNGLIEQFCSLDNLAIEVGLVTALKHLQQLAQEAVFHPQTADAPFQILGMLEGAGLRFDQLWIVGMHSQNFPASVVINPLLPADFQREHEMPHSLPERELLIAQELVADYKKNSQRLILSYPLMHGEEELDVSPLIRDVALVDRNALLTDPSLHPAWLVRPDQCNFVEDRAPVYNPAIENIRGGSNLLKNQSTCPFNAFAIHRLKAEPLEQPSQGLSAMDRGALMHDILFRLWENWQTSTTLRLLSDEQIREQLASVIAETLNSWGPSHPVLLGMNYRALEQSRLQKLLGQWLEEEKQRAPFEVVNLESKSSLRFGDLEISLRLDRVDRIGSKLLIIDYKSGLVKPSSWAGERPADPQLPMYLLASNPAANGCAFAQIRGGAIKFVGNSDSQLIPNEKLIENWSLQVDKWQVALGGLADEFTSGEAGMQIFNAAAFAFQSHLLPLNRWSEEAELKPKADGWTAP